VEAAPYNTFSLRGLSDPAFGHIRPIDQQYIHRFPSDSTRHCIAHPLFWSQDHQFRCSKFLGTSPENTLIHQHLADLVHEGLAGVTWPPPLTLPDLQHYL
jgi:hypothetical protein